MLVGGEVRSFTDLVKVTGLDQRYISRILKLAFLSPAVTQTVLENRWAGDLERLLGTDSVCWRAQEAALLA